MPKIDDKYIGGFIPSADYCPVSYKSVDEGENGFLVGNCKYGTGDYGSEINYINTTTNIYSKGYPNGYLYDNNLIDRDYDEHQKKIRNKPIEEMNYSEILTMLTCIHRAERFCDGAMYDFIKNGKMLKCLVILKEIIEHRNSQL